LGYLDDQGGQKPDHRPAFRNAGKDLLANPKGRDIHGKAHLLFGDHVAVGQSKAEGSSTEKKAFRPH